MAALSKFISVKHGFAFKGEYFQDEETTDVLVTPGNFAIGGGFQHGKYKFYAGPVPEDYVLSTGDLILTMTDLSKDGDTLGYPALVPASTRFRFLHNQRIGLVEFKVKGELDKEYLYYRLCASDYRSFILSGATGSTVRHTSPGRICSFEADIPHITVQRGIASVLSVLDAKINSNKAMANRLEVLIRAIYRAWFVDFEPVKAKLAGAASFPSMPQAVFDALPIGFVDSEIGLIPDGWAVGTLGDIAREKRDSVHPSSVIASTPYIGLEHMPRRSITLSEWGESGSVSSNKIRFSKGDMLFGKLRPYFHKVGVAAIDGVCSTDIVVVQPASPSWFGFILGMISSDEFVAHTNACSGGTKMPRTSWRDMAACSACFPPVAMAKAITEIFEPFVALIASNIFESKKLVEMRDYLLPKLLSGEIGVKSVELEAQE